VNPPPPYSFFRHPRQNSKTDRYSPPNRYAPRVLVSASPPPFERGESSPEGRHGVAADSGTDLPGAAVSVPARPPAGGGGVFGFARLFAGWGADRCGGPALSDGLSAPTVDTSTEIPSTVNTSTEILSNVNTSTATTSTKISSTGFPSPSDAAARTPLDRNARAGSGGGRLPSANNSAISSPATPAEPGSDTGGGLGAGRAAGDTGGGSAADGIARTGARPPPASPLPPCTPEINLAPLASTEPKTYSYTGGEGLVATPSQSGGRGVCVCTPSYTGGEGAGVRSPSYTGGEGHARTPSYAGGAGPSTPFYSPRRLVPVMRASARRRQKDDALEAIQSASRRGSVRALAASLGAQFNPAAPRPDSGQDGDEGGGTGEAAGGGAADGEGSRLASETGVLGPPLLERQETPLDVSLVVSRPKRPDGARPRSRRPPRPAAAEGTG
jgi:hypothetical protein